ncbi:MAG: ABC transporter substrate-binding protein [Bryobacteraceae bacterium]
MRRITFLCLALASAAVAQRPRYGGTLRIRLESGAAQPTGDAFRIAESEGARVLLTANEKARGGRPFLDTVEIELGRNIRDLPAELDLDRADVVELSPADARRVEQRGARVESTRPLDVIALGFDRARPAVREENVRRTLAQSIDRGAIHSVLLQKQGIPADAIVPQWLSGFAFLFERPPAGAASRASITLGVEPRDPLYRLMADRIALNAREAGLTVRVAGGETDVWLVRRAMSSFEIPAEPEKAYLAERDLLAEAWIVPLFHVPRLYGLGARVRNWKTGPAGEWTLEDVWLAAQ